MSLLGKLVHVWSDSRRPKNIEREKVEVAKINTAPPADFRAITSKYEDAAHLAAQPLEVRAANELTISTRPPLGLDYQKLDHQGRRFLSAGRTAAQISAETGRPALEPARFYAALTHGDTPAARVNQLLAAAKSKNAEGKSAFDRDVIVLSASTGSGFIEPIGVNAVESFANGNTATFGFQYNDQASTSSIPDVPEATDELQLLIAGMNDEIKARRARGETVPRLVVLGESLGAAVVESALRSHYFELQDPASRYHVDSMLLTGLPGFRGIPEADVKGKGANGLITRVDPQQDPSTWGSGPYGVANNGDDPVPRMGIWQTLVRKPDDWPRDQRFVPVVSIVQMMKNVGNSTHPIAGKFLDTGHDYRSKKVELVAKYIFGGAPPADLLNRINGREKQVEAARGEMLTAQLDWDTAHKPPKP